MITMLFTKYAVKKTSGDEHREQTADTINFNFETWFQFLSTRASESSSCGGDSKHFVWKKVYVSLEKLLLQWRELF